MTSKCKLVHILLIVFVENIASEQSSLSPYLSWLKSLDGVLQVPPRPDLDSFQFPLEINIVGRTFEQCNPLDKRMEGCYDVKCLHEPTKPLEYYRVLLNETQVNSNRSTLNISFPVNSSEDIYTLIVPFIHTVSSNQTNWRQLNISFEKLGIEGHYVGFSSNGELMVESSNLQEVADYQISQSQQTYNKSYQLAVEFAENQLLVFVDGLLWRRYEITYEPPYTVTVTFSEDPFSGYTSEIKLYNTLATTGELYSLSYGVDIPERLVRPDCECPRRYMDTYSLMKKSSANETTSENLCYGASDGSVPRYTNQYQGIWAIFTTDGWVTDTTGVADFEIYLPQTMFVYSVSGKFMWKADVGEADAIQRPDHMALDAWEIVIDITSDCNDITIHGPNVVYDKNGLLYKCLNWDLVISSRGMRNGYQYVTWEIQVLSSMSGEERFADMFAIDLMILYLYGHYSNSTTGTQSWFHISELSLFTRPHCGGSEYELLKAPPNNIAEYAKFFSYESDTYHCQCPQMMEDDRCENCRTSTQPFRYQTQDLLCLDCDCTDLSLSKSCDYSTGQCTCRPLNDSVVSKDNRRCEWRVTEIVPSYGPIAGDTLILVKGDYITWPEVNITTALFDGEIVQVENRDSELAIVSPVQAVPGDVDIILQSSTSFNVGTVTSAITFNYRSNPYIDEITPRRTILSGGIHWTARGDRMDASVEPMLTVYVTEELLNGTKIQHQFTSECSVVDSSAVVCPSPDLSNSVIPPEKHDSHTRSPLTNLEVKVLCILFDGHTDCESINNLPKIYADPVIDKLQSVLVYALDDQTILLKGKRMDWGAGIQDYSIDIGGWGECDITNLTSDTLLCTPPSAIPQVHQVTDYICYESWPSPYIKVSVGNIETQVGYVYYKDYVNSDDPLNCTLSSNSTSSTSAETATSISSETVTSTSSETAKGDVVNTVIAVMSSVLALMVIGVVIYFIIRRRQSLETNDIEPISKATALVQKQELRSSIRSSIERCNIPKERLSIGQQIGEGHFGLVFKGQLVMVSGCVKTVAVKCLKDDQNLTLEDLEIFLSEGTLMMDFKHKNVMSLLGVVYAVGERPLVVLPYMEKGDLHSFIKRDDLNFVLGDILHFAYQISNGMGYLANQQFVHRDLACRNCMLNDLNIVKIADFGMSRDIDEKNYYRMASMNKPLPIRWMAVESMKYGIFTVKSDAWSYGVTLWELLSRGGLPFTGITNRQVKDHIINGARLHQPTACPPVIYGMMLKCWEEDPEKRPEFTAISGFINGLLTGETAPQAGSGTNEGYYYNRNVTSEVPDNYFTVVDDPDDDYIIVLDATEEIQV